MLLYGLALEGVGYFSKAFWTYMYLLTVAELTGLKKKSGLCSKLPPVVFGPSCIEPPPILVSSLSFYLASRSFYFCLASEFIRFSSWYLFFCIFFLLFPFFEILSHPVVCPSISASIHRFVFHARVMWFVLKDFYQTSLVFSPYIRESVCVPSHSPVFVLNLSLPVQRLPS